MIILDHSNRSFSSSLTPLRMLCCYQVEGERPIPLSWAPGMGRASGATGYRTEAVAGFALLGAEGKGRARHDKQKDEQAAVPLEGRCWCRDAGVPGRCWAWWGACGGGTLVCQGASFHRGVAHPGQGEAGWGQYVPHHAAPDSADLAPTAG